ncbi:hypothetical protein LNTAR_05501 [Lentisphaera araneosa HTCC2155]|uniref:Uncharacterized protein n=2 Tax=Lentisphaera TaxID=256846 RepID=A6DLT7_9BACT|nr:hypothetical protein LNTAR_05501 [Lentisphaera araneosa HTCC2155]
MNASTKDWITHCVVPHNMSEVSQEYHDMWNDSKFLALNAMIILFMVLAFVLAMGFYLPSGVAPQNIPYSPLQYGL